MIDRLHAIGPAPAGRQPTARSGPEGAAFGEILDRARSTLALSSHAQKRIERRQLDLDPARLQRLDQAVQRAAGKGARSTLVLLDSLAVLVDVPGRTVVTALDTTRGKENVFTNIDSVVIA
ncbi:TIGR02530 family flagellar biosynthesis protein [Tepidiforma sp.]|uniref:TIGR02530 family flagellar biosynthesis protein n=1 Tax=Tepidiforma sp. TaxID=2682230 RepID=UPI002ADE7A13|nr:TIGR02530 family flagellar biosynthesis protein [Tepidiforma sp.]